MKVWACMNCGYANWLDQAHAGMPACSMVEMQLVPTDARVVSGLDPGWIPERLRVIADELDLENSYKAPFRNKEMEEAADLLRFFATLVPEEPPKDPWDYDP